MTLIPYKECDQEISSTAKTCPNCGANTYVPTKLSKSNRIFLRLIWISLSIVGLVMFMDTTDAGDTNFIIGIIMFFVGLILLKTSFDVRK